MKEAQQLMAMISRTFTVALVRHGETVSNREGIMQGQLDTELSDLGHEQARLIGCRLCDVNFAHMYSSDLRRAADTARAITAANTVSTGNLVLDKRLRERGFGCLEGKPLTEFFKAVEETGIPSAVYTPEGGETVPQVSERASKFLTSMCLDILKQTETGLTTSHTGSDTLPVSSSPEIVSQPETSSDDSDLPEGHILIVSHGILLRELRNAIMGYFHGNLDSCLAGELKKISPNTGLSEFLMKASRKDNKLTLRVVKVNILNDNSHLTQNGNNLTTHFKGAL